jgi:hypothetical protein
MRDRRPANPRLHPRAPACTSAAFFRGETRGSWNPFMKGKASQRKVLVILSNRFRPLQEPRFIDIVCKDDGTIMSEKPLRGRPARAVYDEVWENDDAKTSLDSCRSVKRHYRHALLKPKS